MILNVICSSNMQTNTPESRTRWVLAVVAAILIYIFFSGWADFKDGFMQGYRNQTKSTP
jgi:hypothetical protein